MDADLYKQVKEIVAQIWVMMFSRCHYDQAFYTRSCLGAYPNCSNNMSILLIDIEFGEFGELPPDILFANEFE